MGNTLDKDKFSETVKTALDNGETSIDVSDEKNIRIFTKNRHLLLKIKNSEEK